jgi:predicted ATPase
MTENIALLAAMFSAIATAFAAFATWSAPRAAARLAESLRREAERHDERQRRKLHVFSTLMQERAQIYSDNGVRALNLIDVVFNESREVRETWSELFLAFQMKPLLQHVIDERLRKLLGAIARDIGLADELRTDDLANSRCAKL